MASDVRLEMKNDFTSQQQIDKQTQERKTVHMDSWLNGNLQNMHEKQSALNGKITVELKKT